MGIAAWAFYGISSRFLSGQLSDYASTAISMLLGICVGVVVYFVLVLALRILRAEDLSAFPKGEKLAKVLRLK